MNTRIVVYPCDRGTGTPMGYHHFAVEVNGVSVCRFCGKQVNNAR